MTAHAAVLVVAIAGDLVDQARSDAPVGAPATAFGGERLHWVGMGNGEGPERPLPHPGVLPPIAYVVPGRGAPREGSPGERSRARARHDGASAAAATRKRTAALRWPSLRPLPPLPLLDLDATVLVAGVLSSAIDLARRASRPEDFVRLQTADMGGDEATRTDVRSPGVLWPVGHVDDLPVALVSNPVPSYPALLAHDRVGGRVLVEFRIDSVGAIDLGTLRVLQSSNALFTQAVRAVLPRLRFLPAQLGQHAVGVTVRQPFVFTIRPGI